MADLKAGTTVGGNTIWSQANLPLLPAGNSLTYKGYKIYSENDPPTKAEVGLGNVINELQVKRSGDDMTGSLALRGNTSQLTVPYRLLMIRESSISETAILFIRPGNNPVTDPPITSDRRIATITARAATTGDPSEGAILGDILVNQKAGGVGLVGLQAYAAPNATTGATGSLSAALLIAGDGTITATGTQTTINMNTAVNGNLQMIAGMIRGSGNRQLYFQDVGGNELGLLYADAGKNMYIRSGGSFTTRFASDGTLVLANHLSVPEQSMFGGPATFNNRAIVQWPFADIPSNNSMLRIVTNDGNNIGDGHTHFGYKDANGKFNHYFRGLGFATFDMVSGCLFRTPSFYNDVPQGTPAQYFLSVGTQGAKNLLRQFRGGSGDSIWHETVQSGVYRIATGVTDGQEEFSLVQGQYASFPKEVRIMNVVGSGGQLRLTVGSGGYGLIIRNDASTTYFLLTASNDALGPWNTLRPLSITNSTGIVGMSQGLVVAGTGVNINAGGLDVTGGSINVNSGGGVNVTANGAALNINATTTATAVYLLGRRAGTNSFYIGMGGADTTATFHNYLEGTTFQLRPDDLYCNKLLYVNGNVNAADVYIRSDIRLKSNLVELKDALSKVEQLKGYIYDKQVTEEINERESGIIAQDLQKVLPEAVREVKETGMLTISPSGVNALLVNAINELRERLEAIENKLGA